MTTLAPLPTQTVRLDLNGLLDNRSTTTPDRLDQGRLNVWRNSFPAAGVIHVECDGVKLRADLAGHRDDNVRCDGQVVNVSPVARYDWLYFLACSERRSRSRFVQYFGGGHTWEQDVDVSDLWEGSPAHGELLAWRSEMIHYPTHVQPRVGLTLWVQRLPIPPRLPLTHLRLPRGGAVHLFDAVLVPSSAASAGEGTP